MKHLILKDDETTFMVYYRPNDKARLIELIYNTQKDYWTHDYTKQDWGLIVIIYQKLVKYGYKVKDITDELKQGIDIYSDFNVDEMFYKGIKITERNGGFGFYNGEIYNATKTIEQAIKVIDNE